MKRSLDSSSESEDEEEPRIQDVLNDLPKAVSHSNASELLHSMAASRDVLFWTPRGELLRNQRRIPVTNIADLVEYVLLPYSRAIPRPRALDTFLGGLAELGINKRWIRNKTILNDLFEKEKQVAHEEASEAEEDSDTEENEDESSQEENEVDQTLESDEEASGPQTDGEEVDEPCDSCENTGLDVNTVVGCPRCLWHDLLHFPLCDENKTACSICQHEFPLNNKSIKQIIKRCNRCNTTQHTTPRTGKVETFDLNQEEEESEV